MTPTSLVTAQNSADSHADANSLLSPHVGTLEGHATYESDAEKGFGNRFSLACKQGIDRLIAGALMLVTLPVFAVTALAIKVTSRGPVFYVQKRVGQSGRTFRFFKFRTMRHDSDDRAHRDFARDFIQNSGANGKPHSNPEHGPVEMKPTLVVDEHNHAGKNGNGNGKVYKMTADPRVTAVGRFLRRTSLDELPQIFNVLRGEMSMVGPRPPVPYEVEHYQEWHKRRLAAKPGITGLWQVSGRSSVPFDEMVLLDLYYIENRSTAMDIRIMAKTLPVMVKGDGAY